MKTKFSNCSDRRTGSSNWRAFGLAVLMHLALVLFLWAGIHWKNHPPQTIEAEVWDVKIQDAAPRAPKAKSELVERKAEVSSHPAKVQSKLAVPNPDIAIEQARKKAKTTAEKFEQQATLLKQKQHEQEQLALEKQQKIVAEKQKEAAEKVLQESIKEQRQKTLNTLIAQASTSGSSGTALKSKGTTDPSYAGKIIRIIRSNLYYPIPANIDGNPRAHFQITQLPNGTITAVRLLQSSGLASYDTAVEKAIWASSPLPQKKDGSVETQINATFHLKDATS